VSVSVIALFLWMELFSFRLIKKPRAEGARGFLKCWGLCLLANACEEPRKEVADGDSLLFHGVAVADGDGVLLRGVIVVLATLADSVEVDGDAERGAHFVLATVAAANGCGLVIEDVHEGLEEGLFFSKGRMAALMGAMEGLKRMTVRMSGLPPSLVRSSSS